MRVLETHRIRRIPTYRWCDRRDSNPHVRAGNAAVCLTTSDRTSCNICPGAIRTLILALNRRSHYRGCATGQRRYVVGGGAGNRTLIRCLQDSNPTVERNPLDRSPLYSSWGEHPVSIRNLRIHRASCSATTPCPPHLWLEPPPRLARGCPHYGCGASLSTLWRPTRGGIRTPTPLCVRQLHDRRAARVWRVGQDLNLRGAFAQRGYGPPPSASRSPTHVVVVSGPSESNRPPSPYQSDALPSELGPNIWCPRQESNLEPSA